MVVKWKAIAMRAVDHAPQNLQFPTWLRILEWMHWIDNPGAASRWMSWFQLLASFHVWTGEWGLESTSCHNTWRLHNKL